MPNNDNENSIMSLFKQFQSWLGNGSTPDSDENNDENNDENGWAQNMGQWGNAAKGAAALGGVFNNFQQIKEGKKQLEKDNKFRDMNYANTVITTNSQVADQWGAKFARAGGEGTAGAQRLGSLDDYMKNRGVS